MLTGPAPLPELAPLPGVTGLAVGVFDGVHLGHQAVVRSLTGPVAALTFEPHPLTVIAPARVPPRLTTLAQKRELLAGAGAVAVVAVEFNAALRQCTAAEFVAHLARVFPALRQIAIGRGWAFGRGREGDVTQLAALGTQHGFGVCAIDPVLLEGAPVSSTRVREAILRRDFTLAERLLGRPYAVTGHVVHGEARGRSLGFPTANLAGVAQLLPPRGVYAARVTITGQAGAFLAVLNLGRRPTFTSNGTDSIEVHLLDFSGDLYGAELTVAAWRWLRDERPFADATELKKQIERDVLAARTG